LVECLTGLGEKLWLVWKDLHSEQGVFSASPIKRQSAPAKTILEPNIFILGLMDEEGGVAGRVLRELGMTSERVREVVQRVSSASTEPLTRTASNSLLKLNKSSNLQLTKPVASAITTSAPNTFCSGLVRVESTAMEVLRRLGVTADQIRRQTRRVLNESASSSPTPAGPQPGKGGASAANNPKPRSSINSPPT
jgi:ATP-dependent Clp protease ATP-binding subunit ClpA